MGGSLSKVMEADQSLTQSKDGRQAFIPGLMRLGLLVGGLGLMLLGELQIFRGLTDAGFTAGLPLTALGLFMVVWSTRNALWEQSELALWNVAARSQPVRIRPGLLGWALLLMGVVGWLETQQPDTALWEYLLVWGTSIVALVVAVLPRRTQVAPLVDESPFLRWEYIALIGLLLGALAVRTIALNNMPYMLDQDEAALAREGAAFAYLNHFQVSPFEPGVFSQPNAQAILIGLSTLIFGKTLFAARIISALFGALTVPSVYLLGREVFNRKVGLVAALFMLGWAFQAHFTRLALNQAGDVFFSTLACYFLVRGLRRQTALNYFLSGACLALAQLFYVGARLVPLLMVAYLGYLLLRQPSVIIRQWRQIGTLALTTFVVSFPQNFWLVYSHQPVSALFANESILAGPLQQSIQDGSVIQTVINQLYAAFGSLFFGQDTNGWYGAGSNIMGWIGAPLLVVGTIALILVLWRYPRTSLPVLWALGVVVGGAALQTNSGSYERFVPGASALALLVAAGVWYWGIGVGRVFSRPVLVRYLMPIAGVLILIGNTAFYVFDFVPARQYFANYQNRLTNRVASEMVTADQAGRYIVLIGDYPTGVMDTPVIQYYMMGDKYTYIQDSLAAVLSSSDPAQSIDYSRPLTFIVSPARLRDLATITTLFPGGTAHAVYLTETKTLAYYVYEVDQSRPAQQF